MINEEMKCTIDNLSETIKQQCCFHFNRGKKKETFVMKQKLGNLPIQYPFHLQKCKLIHH